MLGECLWGSWIPSSVLGVRCASQGRAKVLLLLDLEFNKSLVAEAQRRAHDFKRILDKMRSNTVLKSTNTIGMLTEDVAGECGGLTEVLAPSGNWSPRIAAVNTARARGSVLGWIVGCAHDSPLCALSWIPRCDSCHKKSVVSC